MTMVVCGNILNEKLIENNRGQSLNLVYIKGILKFICSAYRSFPFFAPQELLLQDAIVDNHVLNG